MSVTLDSVGGLIEAGLFVRPEFASLLDSLPQAELEERFIKHGTVVVHGKDHLLFQAVKVRGAATAREIFFAPSETPCPLLCPSSAGLRPTHHLLGSSRISRTAAATNGAPATPIL